MRSTPHTASTISWIRAPPIRAFTSMMRGPWLVHLPSTCSTPDRNPNDWTVCTQSSTRRRTGLAVVVRRAVQTGLLKRRLGRRPVLRDAREHALPVLHDQVDVELDAVEVLLQQRDRCRARKIDVVLGIYDCCRTSAVDARERLEVVDPDAPHGAAPNSGFTTAGKPTWAAAAIELVERPHAPRRGVGRPSWAESLTRAHLAARRIDRLRRVAGQAQCGRDPCRHADAVLPEGEHAVRPDAGRRQRVEHRLRRPASASP